MNSWLGAGRIVYEPIQGMTNKNPAMKTVRYTIAVDDTGKDVNFITCVAFGKQAEYAIENLHKGINVAVRGRLQNGTYEDSFGKKKHFSRVVVGFQEICNNGNNCQEPADLESDIPDPPFE